MPPHDAEMTLALVEWRTVDSGEPSTHVVEADPTEDRDAVAMVTAVVRDLVAQQRALVGERREGVVASPCLLQQRDVRFVRAQPGEDAGGAAIESS